MAGNVRLSSSPAGLFEIIPLPVRDVPLYLAIALPSPSLVRMPGFPRAALPDSGRVASGRGLSSELCRASALGEAAELVSCCAWGTERLVTALDRELGPAALLPEVLNGFSTAQIDCRRAWNTRYAGFDWRPPLRDPKRPIEWLKVEDARGGPSAYAPADFAFIRRRKAGDDAAVAIGDSNGCACGLDVDSAKLAAVLELLERDAAARWWYGRRRRPLLDWSRLGNEGELTAWLASRPRRTWLFDITADIDIPVAVAASAEADGSDVVLGFAARLGMRDAAVAALTEMLQMEFSLAAARELGDTAEHWRDWRARVRMTTPPLNATPIRGDFADSQCTLPSLAAVIEACARQGIRIWFADMTREAIGVPAFRAISPDLCHLKPRFARKRLLAPDRRDIGPVLPGPEDQVPQLI
jgi:ribosomal protein S12 methylthiotransferase accessory factor